MYPIDFNTCTMRDVIERSLVCHPSLFAEQLAQLRDMHARYSNETHNQEVKRIARGMSGDCAGMIAAINTLDTVEALDCIMNSTNAVIAFDAAARLNAIPRSLWSDIVERSQSVPA